MRVLIVMALAVMLSGCVFTGQNSIDKTNEMIVERNEGRLTAFSSALSACDEKPGCLVGVSLAFASNMGQQPLLRPETGLDYVRELRQWIDPVGNIIDRINGSDGVSGDRAGSYVKGDGNTILIGNRSSADNQSSSSFSLNQSYTRTWDGYNRDYTGQQPISDAGLGEVQ